MTAGVRKKEGSPTLLAGKEFLRSILQRRSSGLGPIDQQAEYLFWIFRLFEEVREVPGHIMEIGVGDGRNSILFSALIRLHQQSSSRHYLGFDTFNGFEHRDLEQNPHLEASRWQGEKFSLHAVEKRVRQAGYDDLVTLVAGDVVTTLPVFLHSGHTPKSQRGHLGISLLYVDCNAYTPAKVAIEKIWPLIVPGGLVAVDEKIQGGESRAVLAFAEEKKLKPFRLAEPSPPMLLRKE